MVSTEGVSPFMVLVKREIAMGVKRSASFLDSVSPPTSPVATKALYKAEVILAGSKLTNLPSRFWICLIVLVIIISFYKLFLTTIYHFYFLKKQFLEY